MQFVWNDSGINTRVHKVTVELDADEVRGLDLLRQTILLAGHKLVGPVGKFFEGIRWAREYNDAVLPPNVDRGRGRSYTVTNRTLSAPPPGERPAYPVCYLCGRYGSRDNPLHADPVDPRYLLHRKSCQ